MQGIHLSNIDKTSTTLSVKGEELYDEAYKIFYIVNKERKLKGLSPLTMNRETMKAAMIRASEQSLYYSHTRPNGSSCFSVIESAGIPYNVAGENIAAGYENAKDVMKGWMSSPGHRKNILSNRYHSMGVGVFRHNGITYYAQTFTDLISNTSPKPNNKTITQNISISKKKIKLKMDRKKLNMHVGDKNKLYLLNINQGWPYSIAILNNQNIKWISSNNDIAKVSNNGKVTATGCGSCKIKATLTTGKKSICKIEVKRINLKK